MCSASERALDPPLKPYHIIGMRKRAYLSIAVTLVALAAVSLRQALREREPVYRGKPLSVWLKAYQLHGLAGVETWQVREEQQDADEAVRHTGTNALPTLLRMLRAEDPAWKVKLLNLAARQHAVKITYTPAEERNYQACCAFGVLGAKARSAVPALVDIINQHLSQHSQGYSLAALASIGPLSEEAIPFLSDWATNADSGLRLFAVNALSGIRAEPSRVLPVLTWATQDPVPEVRASAIRAVQANQDPERSQP
jgi:hypothetical protein